MDDDTLLAVLHEAAGAVAAVLSTLDDWGRAGRRSSQYHLDLVADEAAIAVLDKAGLGVLSEESGLQWPERDLLAVLDPVDGSTNASRRIPWYATSICVLDGEGARAAVVANQAGGARYSAVRDGGAWRDGLPIRPSSCQALADAIVGLNGYPDRYLGWRQFRALGAAALDLCAVADGTLDAYLDVVDTNLAPWDYLGGMLVCQEAGASVADARGRDLVVRDHSVRRSRVAAATPALLAELRAAGTAGG